MIAYINLQILYMWYISQLTRIGYDQDQNTYLYLKNTYDVPLSNWLLWSFSTKIRSFFSK